MARIIDAGAALERIGADGAAVVTRDASLIVEDGVIAAIVPGEERRRRYPQEAGLGGPGFVAAPGFVNAHHHVGTTPFQLGSPDHPLELWFASRLGLRDVDLRLDTLVSAFEMIESGVTTVQHLHSRAPGTADDVIDAATRVVGAYREIGMRASYSMALRDQNRLVYEADEAFVARLPEALRAPTAAYLQRFTLPLEEQARIFRGLLAMTDGDARIAAQLAPANLHWLSEAALELAGALSEETGALMHMHLVETPYQCAYARRRTGGTAFEHVRRAGLAGPKLTLGHGVWMSAADIRACAETGTRLCHNCSSNFRLKSGVAPLARFVAEGVPVAIGIDEAGINDDRDMLQEMRLVLDAHRKPGVDTPHLSAAEVFRMATEGGAGTTPFGDRIGTLRVGAAADVVLYDWARVTAPWQSPDTPLVDVLVRRAKAGMIKAVIIGGEVVYRDGRFTRVDRAGIFAEIAERFGRPPTPAEEARCELGAALLPHVRQFYEGWLGPGDLDLPVA